MRIGLPLLSLTIIFLIIGCTDNRKVTTRSSSNLSSFDPDKGILVYASNDSAKVYSKIGSAEILTTYRLGDSLLIECDDPDVSCETFDNHWYKAHIKINGEERRGFIWGFNIANGQYLDIDDDSKNELILLGYDGVGKSEYDNPASLKVLKNRTLFIHYKFKAYSYMFVRKIDAGFVPHIPVMAIEYGLGACDYPNYSKYVYYESGAFHDILTSVDIGNEFGGESSTFVFPKDSMGQYNKIVEFRSLVYNEDNADREPGDTNRFDTAIYEFKDNSFKVVYQTKNID